MAISDALRGANPGSNHAEDLIQEVRKRIAADPAVLREARERRNRVFELAMGFPGALDTFPSGSLAHATVNDPVSDGDGGVILDRRTWPELGPDGAGVGPETVMQRMAGDLLAELRLEYPSATVEVLKRAIMFEFHDPMGDEDPSVDLVVCLTRLAAPGFWIPNTESGGWNASHPLKHTEMMTAEPKALRVHRAQTVRLVKAAVKNDGDDAVLCPWNISALALDHITGVRPLAVSVSALFRSIAASVAAGLTPDPAGVSAPIKLPAGVSHFTAARRLGFFADCVDDALAHADDRSAVLAALGQVFPDQLPEARQGLNSSLRNGNTGAAVISAFGAATTKTPRSYGGARH